MNNIETIKNIIAKRANYENSEDITMDLSFEQDLELEGRSYNKLIQDLEDEFNIEIQSYAAEFETVFDLVEFIRESL